MELFVQINEDIIAAMKAKDKVRLEALRNIKKFFIEAITAPGAGGELTDDTALKILAKLAKQGHDAAALYESQQRPDLAEAERAQVAVIEEYLPARLSETELEEALRAIISEVGAASPADMGRVMGVAFKRLAGKAEGKAIADGVRRLLLAIPIK